MFKVGNRNKVLAINLLLYEIHSKFNKTKNFGDNFCKELTGCLQVATLRPLSKDKKKSAL